MKKKNIHLKRSFEHTKKKIYVDENQIEQVIFNLLLNAMDAIRAEGEIGVRIYDQPLVSDHTDEMVGIDIYDNGCGISEDALEKIFNPFYTTKNDGVGLGLSISLRLIEENGGFLHVSSSVGKGSVFKIILPCA